MRRRHLSGVLIVLSGIAALAAGCGDGVESTGTTTLTVFAAASLTGPFAEIGERFEAEYEGADVQFSFAGSSDLAAQLTNGAPADVFASADERTMERVTSENLLAGEPTLFASNVLQIATGPGNPTGIESLADLTRDGVAVVMCAPTVPCGAASERVEEAAGIEIAPVSEESSVTDVLTKVTSGEADAGLVYATDVVRAGDAADGVDVPESDAAVNRYPIATMADSDQTDAGQAFVDFVTGPEGRDVLDEAGFGQP